MNVPYIGKIKSKFNEPVDPDLMRKEESEVIVFDEYAEGLFKTELSDYLVILFHFDRAEEFQLKTHTRSGNYKGVFATCSPRRPSKIGSTIVKLIERNDNILKVHGLDALNDSPVIDIKPLHIPLTEEELKSLVVQSKKTPLTS